MPRIIQITISLDGEMQHFWEVDATLQDRIAELPFEIATALTEAVVRANREKTCCPYDMSKNSCKIA
jgi:hypothetical protein